MISDYSYFDVNQQTLKIAWKELYNLVVRWGSCCFASTMLTINLDRFTCQKSTSPMVSTVSSCASTTLTNWWCYFRLDQTNLIWLGSHWQTQWVGFHRHLISLQVPKLLLIWQMLIYRILLLCSMHKLCPTSWTWFLNPIWHPLQALTQTFDPALTHWQSFQTLLVHFRIPSAIGTFTWTIFVASVKETNGSIVRLSKFYSRPLTKYFALWTTMTQPFDKNWYLSRNSKTGIPDGLQQKQFLAGCWIPSQKRFFYQSIVHSGCTRFFPLFLLPNIGLQQKNGTKLLVNFGWCPLRYLDVLVYFPSFRKRSNTKKPVVTVSVSFQLSVVSWIIFGGLHVT